MNKYTLSALSLTGGVLTGLAWTSWCPGIILLISWVPFLIIENYIFENPKKFSQVAFFNYMLPGFVIFTLMTTGWIRAVSITAAVFMIILASVLMSFTLWVAHLVRMKAGTLQGIVSLISFWLTFEFLCLRIPVLSPWICLGNGLAKDIRLVQWYETTGIAGGTLWILLSNLLLTAFLIIAHKNKIRKPSLLIVWLALVIIPSALSLIRYTTIKSGTGKEEEVIVVQPDYDPFSEKFEVPFYLQLENALKMADLFVTEKTTWCVTPETTVDDPVDEGNLENSPYIMQIRDFLRENPSLNLVTGFVTFRASSSSFSDTAEYFNSALKIDTGKVIEIYNKSKLVPGFESSGKNGLLKILTPYLPVLGGINRGFTSGTEQVCFESVDKSVSVAPVICYESVFGEYVGKFIKKGAGALFVITNDGWWKGTSGYKHHLSYSALRAIETRRPVIRSANTGISCIIDIKGNIVQKSGWFVPAVLKGTFTPEKRITPYVRYGDYIMKMACIISILTVLTYFLIIPAIKKSN